MHLELRDISRNKNSAKILELKITQGHRRRRQENTRHGHQEKKKVMINCSTTVRSNTSLKFTTSSTVLSKRTYSSDTKVMKLPYCIGNVSSLCRNQR